MTLIRPTRRELLRAIPFVAGASIFAKPIFAQISQRPLNFLVVGDWGRNGSDFQRHVALQMGLSARDLTSDFVVSTGDNFYNLGVSSKTDSQWGTSFRDIYTAESLQKPWFPVFGNHDYGGSARAQLDYITIEPRWQMLNYWYPVRGDQYGLRRPDVHMFFINTVVWNGREGLPYSVLGSGIKSGQQEAQRNWLISELDAIGRSEGIKLVFGHHPIHSVGPHGGRMGLQELDEILRHYNVAAYICGHDHCLYHITHRGMHYICSGAGSRILTSYTGGLEPGCVLQNDCPSGPRWHAFLSIAGFAAFQVTDRVNFQFIDIGGNVRHSATL